MQRLKLMHIFGLEMLRCTYWHRIGLDMHEKNDAYKNVILHVVWEDDVSAQLKKQWYSNYRTKGKRAKSIFRKKYLFYQNHPFLPKHDSWCSDGKYASMYRMLVERLEEKAEMEKIYQQTNASWEDTLYIMMVRYFGTKVNREPFEDVGTPCSTVHCHEE